LEVQFATRQNHLSKNIHTLENVTRLSTPFHLILRTRRQSKKL